MTISIIAVLIVLAVLGMPILCRAYLHSREGGGRQLSTIISLLPLCSLVVLLLLILPILPASADTIPLEQDRGTYLLPVRINDAITLKFVLDSGASDVSIPADVVNTLIRTGTIEARDFIGTQIYVLADGSRLPSPQFIIRELKVGDYVVRNVTANVAPVAGLLLLGQSFLSKLPTWTIDNNQHALIFSNQPASIDSPKSVPPPAPQGQNDSTAEAINRGIPAEEMKNLTEAERWYFRAASQGNAIAQFNLGAMYWTGQGVPLDHAEAVRWYRLAAEQGYAIGQNNLGYMYENGLGVPKDVSQAIEWYRKAAAQGNTNARDNLKRLGAN